MALILDDVVQIIPQYNLEEAKQTLFKSEYIDSIEASEASYVRYGEEDGEFLRALVESSGYDSSVWRWPPAKIQDWLLGKRYLNLNGVIRKCVYEDIVNFFESIDGNPWNRKFHEAVFEEGIGSGKSFKTACIATFFQQLLLCLREPYKYFGGDKSSKIAIMNMSISERNAVKVIFSEIKSKIDGCEWFNERPWERDDARMPDPNCLSELRFKNNTFIIPGSSSWRTAVGYNIIVGMMDEAGGYRKSDNSDQADDIYHALQRRLGSRFEEKGAIIVAGSPMYENDFLEAKMKEGLDPASKVYARRRTLWESKYPDWNADYFYVDKIQRLVLDAKPENMEGVDAIPLIPFLFKAFKANVTKAYRDFGATPSATINAFFENPKILLERYNRNRTIDPVDNLGSFRPSFKCIEKHAFYAIHVDLALTGDACGLALGHHGGLTDEGGTIIYIDLMMRFKGSPEAPIRISKIREIIYSLQQMGFPIKQGIVTYDGFQSSDSIQMLQAKGYNVELLSVDRTTLPYSNLKEAINENRIDYYMVPSNIVDEPSPSQVFISECSKLEEIEGKKIDHPPRGCLSGDTRVALLDGTNPTFEQLVREKSQKKFYVYTFDGKMIKAGLAYNPRITKMSKTIEIELDNFQIIRCTPDHLFMKYDGSYLPAKDILESDILLPFYRSISIEGGWKGWERLWQPRLNQRSLTHQIIASQFEIRGERIHHIDENKRNNLPSNLEGMTMASHAKVHIRDYSKKKIIKDFDKIDCRTSRQKGHRILSIKKNLDSIPVYDLTVENTHNFALTSGVFVHNSKDVADAVAGVVHNLIEKANYVGKVQVAIL